MTPGEMMKRQRDWMDWLKNANFTMHEMARIDIEQLEQAIEKALEENEATRILKVRLEREKKRLLEDALTEKEEPKP